MARGKGLLGLDIGSNSVKICMLKETRNGYRLQAFDMVELPPEAIVDGVIMNTRTVVDAIRNLVSRNRIKTKDCAISVSGYSVIVKRITLPLMSETELEDNFQWEVEQHIPFDINDVFIDKQILTQTPHVGTMDVLLVAAKRQMVDEYVSVARDAGMNPRCVDVDCFCLQNMYEMAYGIQDGKTIALLDLGASITSMIIVSNGVTSFTRDISMGGQQFTEEIQKQLNITWDEAEVYKVGGREGEMDAVVPSEVEEVMYQVSESISQEIYRSLNFYLENSSEGDIHQIVLTGGSAKVPTLARVLNQLTHVPVEVGNPFARMEYDPKTYNPDYLDDVAPMAAVAVGLALRRTVEK